MPDISDARVIDCGELRTGEGRIDSLFLKRKGKLQEDDFLMNKICLHLSMKKNYHIRWMYGPIILF